MNSTNSTHSTNVDGRREKKTININSSLGENKVRAFLMSLLLAAGQVVLPTSAALLTSCGELEQGIDTKEKEKQPEYLAWDVTLKNGDKIEANKMKVMVYGTNKNIVECKSGTWLESVDLNGNVIRKNGVSTPYSTENLKEGEYTLNFTVATSGGDGIIYKADKRTITIEGEEVLEINKLKESVNIFGGAEVKVENNQLLVGNVPVVSWEKGSVIDVKVYFNGEVKTLPCILSEPGILKIEFDGGNTSASVNLTLTCEGVFGLDELVAKLNSQGLCVGDSVDFTEIKPAEGVEICGFYMMDGDGNKIEIENPKNRKLTKVGNFYIGVELQGPGGGRETLWSKNSIVVDVLNYEEPNILKVDPGEYIEPLKHLSANEKRLYKEALEDWEKTADMIGILEMLVKYNGNYRKYLEENLTIALLGEVPPDGSVEYETLGETHNKPDDHSLVAGQYMSYILNKTSISPLLVIDTGSYIDDLCEYAKNNPDKIVIGILSQSAAMTSKDMYKSSWNTEEILKKMKDIPNLRLLAPVCNGENKDGKDILYTYQENLDLPEDGTGAYNISSMADPSNGEGGRPIIVSLSLNDPGGGTFPKGFLKRKLHGREAPIPCYKDGRLVHLGKKGMSYRNFNNALVYSGEVALLLGAGVEDLGSIDDKIFATDSVGSISFNGEVQEVGVFDSPNLINKNLMPKFSEEIDFKGENVVILEKGIYPLAGFSGPGIVVKLGDKWVPFSGDLKEIKEYYPNPKDVIWGVSLEVLLNSGYKIGDKIEIKRIALRDDWEEFVKIRKSLSFIIKNTI